ncbi:MAG: response regulator [Flavobacteriales bacterium]|nr:response regulator [Flavobacteriales bacterium]
MGHTAIIADDEKHSRETLRMELEQHCPEVSIVALCSSGPEAIEAVKQHAPDLIFLDVQMPRMDGFQVLEKLGDIKGQVIFVTAFDQYAIRAFRFSAVDYLLKPVQPSELKQAVQRSLLRGDIAAKRRCACSCTTWGPKGQGIRASRCPPVMASNSSAWRTSCVAKRTATTRTCM